MKLSEPIYITQPALPPLEEFTEYLGQIWESKILTNNGPFHQQFEKELADYLGVKYLSLFVNGTLALVTALQALRITGEVITTPFSFVATTHAIWWNNIKPVFVDIEPDYFTLDPGRIEAAITPQTTAIMPVHVYGNPCMVEKIQKIADTYGLKVVYDAAHAFGVKVNGNSILNYGDLSILSFHATKTFNTIEGGAIICHDDNTKKRIDLLKNFGFANEVTVIEPGINAKMNELQAAYGLVQLKHVDDYIAKRKTIAELYRSKLSGIKGIKVLHDIEGISHSYTYFPIFIDAKHFSKSRNEVYEKLKANNIYGRRYFYPLISQFPTYRSLLSAHKGNLPIAEKITEQVICLPIYPDLSDDIVLKICRLISK
ncbi:MAG: DegT/DnrJ/EryC1/StrS family aminotransferase [Bacteroidales bacterium]|jgi:dTDP-4-amino-4,6-dideoxygalactose transaminase